MLRPVQKSGQWQNTEDEVLKAAVMKYGMNNWSRVASLLNRKTSRQCRARWYEWLDPHVRKTPWSQQEDEKLLHAVKLFPTQWKTIAPIVGRTAHQCLMRYGELLDMASGRRLEETSALRAGLGSGEIDANPETRPAKPDAVDLDDDEKEMLAEARARLANTKGKKAKRKAREKQLDSRRRSIMIQRRKELEEAGITTKDRYTQRIDYSTEIPYEARPKLGLYDPSNEQTLPEEREAAVRKLQQLEVARVNLRTQMHKLAEKRRVKAPADTTANQAFLTTRQRASLSLPLPQASDAELLQLARSAQKDVLSMPKVNEAGLSEADEDDEDGDEALKSREQAAHMQQLARVVRRIELYKNHLPRFTVETNGVDLGDVSDLTARAQNEVTKTMVDLVRADEAFMPVKSYRRLFRSPTSHQNFAELERTCLKYYAKRQDVPMRFLDDAALLLERRRYPGVDSQDAAAVPLSPEELTPAQLQAEIDTITQRTRALRHQYKTLCREVDAITQEYEERIKALTQKLDLIHQFSSQPSYLPCS